MVCDTCVVMVEQCWSIFTAAKDALLRLGYEGNIAGAWRHLDADMSGTITMREYDPESSELLSSFKEWVEAHESNCIAWVLFFIESN
eukprot:4185369-Amphidinium_carterae.1